MTYGLIFIGVIIATVLFKINHPEVKWGCLIGVHSYHYSHEKHGMYIDTKSNNVIGTKRKIYTCGCGKQKPVSNVDWIKS